MEDLIHSFELFKELSADEYSGIREYFTVREFSQGDAVRGSKELFIVVKGSVATKGIRGDTAHTSVKVFKPGEIFGEISLCNGHPLNEGYSARENTAILTIDQAAIFRLIADKPVPAVKFVSQLLGLTVKRLRGYSRFLADIVQWGESASRRVITDELTGVYNRLFLDDVLQSFFEISKSNGKSLALFMLDVDKCRVINEQFGMDTGNAILQRVVSVIRESISSHGIIARYGGDEFSILLPETDVEKALAIAEEIRTKVAGFDYSALLSGENFPVSISIGISVYPETVTELTVFKEKADHSLYEAKRLGRNRVACIR